MKGKKCVTEEFIDVFTYSVLYFGAAILTEKSQQKWLAAARQAYNDEVNRYKSNNFKNKDIETIFKFPKYIDPRQKPFNESNALINENVQVNVANNDEGNVPRNAEGDVE
uniref:Uncharacterized protein n=1 Tax=Panagrolaimus sp. JU765 TaxID=591449 RepID=A0AC34Q7D9_9BILA